jgi:ribonuclease G
MKSEIIADCGAEESRVALLEDGELVEVYIEKTPPQSLVGNIYRGKVSSVLPGMQAAFIDIGHEKNAFLYVADAVSQKEYHETEVPIQNEDIESDAISQKECPEFDDEPIREIKDIKIEDILKQGQELTVQVIKDPIGTKGPRVTTNVTIPGRHLVLLPHNDYIGVSRRIEEDDERAKLKSIAESIKPEGMGLIVRTVSSGKNGEDFEYDINFLVKLWDSIKKKEESGTVPRCIHKDVNLIYRAVRDLFTRDVQKFVINNEEQYENVTELIGMMMPSLKLKVELYSKDYEIFEYYQIENKISRAIERKVWLNCGGYLVIDPTEALTVIDVNTGKYTGAKNLEDTVLKANIEAAKEIARQIRIRNIGGIIIIDFIDMQEPENRQEVLETLKTELKKDRTKTTVVGMTGLGLIEMTRKKMRLGLSSIMSETCPNCNGTGRVLTKRDGES